MEQNNLEEIKANANERGSDGQVKLELKDFSNPVPLSPNRAVGLREEALKEKVQLMRKEDGLRDPNALGSHVGF